MKKQIKPNLQTTVFITIAAIIFMFAASSFTAIAQTRKYKPGDRIECDVSDIGVFFKGTVVPYEKNDLGTDSGNWYRVKKDGSPDWLTFECRVTLMRPLVEKDDSQNNSEEDKQSEISSASNQSSNKNKATKYKPGDRVECDKASIGIWEKGTVMAFLPDDTNKNSGNFYRVRLDPPIYGGLYVAGHECRTENIRPLNEAPIKASGKYKVGDQIEAQNSNLSWLPAKIIAVEGAFYTVRFDSRDERYDETIDDLRIRKIGGEKAKTADASNNPKTTTPKTAVAATSLPGSAWSLRLYSKSKGYSADGTVMTMLFCPNGTWDTVRYGLAPGNAGAVGGRGTYKVAGKTLTLKNGQGGQTESYTITWLDTKTVELSDGSDIIWRLFDGVKSDCR